MANEPVAPTDPSRVAPVAPSGRPMRERARTALLSVILAVALAVFAWIANQHYPLREWLLFTYLRYWLFAVLFSTACLSTGLRLLKIILREPPRLGEQMTLG